MSGPRIVSEYDLAGHLAYWSGDPRPGEADPCRPGWDAAQAIRETGTVNALRIAAERAEAQRLEDEYEARWGRRPI